jgi:hypothetical protein
LFWYTLYTTPALLNPRGAFDKIVKGLHPKRTILQNAVWCTCGWKSTLTLTTSLGKCSLSRLDQEATVSVHLKSNIAWKSRLRVVYIQHRHSSIQRSAFYKGQNCEGLAPKVDNTSKRGVAYLGGTEQVS